MTALKTYSASQAQARKATPQNRRTPGRTDEVRNNAGGFVFKVSDKDRLERFLILGVDGGTYYVTEKSLTKQNVGFVKRMIRDNERLVVDTTVAVSDSGRAAKNSAALFVMAMVMIHGEDKAYARAAVQKVARTSTHLFEYAQYLNDLGKWGRAKRNSIADWYTSKDADQLAYQAVKYRQRDGWTHRDLFRLAHPKGVDQNVGNFILGKDVEPGVNIIDGFRAAQAAGSVKETLEVIAAYKNLPWEALRTEHLTDARVWKALFYNGAMGQTAVLRNVSRLQKNGAFDDLVFAGDYAKALSDRERIVKGRMHPVAYANALGVYGKGGAQVDYYSYASRPGFTPNAKILGALEDGFYASFDAVEPSNKPTMLAVDVSGSMTWGAPAGLVGLTYLEAAAVMAMVTLRTEPYADIRAFSTTLKSVNVSDRDSFKSVVDKFNRIGMGGTDCSAPMRFAEKNRLEVDTFAVYTDNETWAGAVKPAQALVNYRQRSGREARLAVVAMAATPFTIADPNDRGMMDFVGFDSSAPRVLADFSAGRI